MNNTENKKIRVIIISLTAVITILLCAGTAVGFILLSNNTQEGETEKGIVFDSNASHYDATVENDSNDSSGIKVPGYSDIVFSSDSTDFPITLLNPEDNPCNFQFKLSLKETGEQLCSTGLVKPGDAIKGVKLQNTIPKGTYTLVINISTSSLDSAANMNGAQVQTTLTVK